MSLRAWLDPIPLKSPAALAFAGCSSVVLSLILVAGLSAQTTYTVNSTDDTDDGTCDAVHCSLREAITAANHAVDGAIVAFSIAGAGPHTIQPASILPNIEEDITVDGTTEPDFAGTPVIELDGTAAGPNNGLNIVLSNNTIRGLVINRFQSNGIQLHTDAANNLIEGNYVGTDVTGTVDLGNGSAGVFIGEAPNNTVGGTTASARNLISGNLQGVAISGVPATGNVVLGNYIGTDVTGTVSLSNDVGILILAPGNTVGGSAAGAGNLISGNTQQGINLAPDNTTGTLVAGNYIGLDATGTSTLGNDIGVWVDNVASNTIGGTSAGARNVISGNREGIGLWDAGAADNVVQGNYIGTSAAGNAAIPNDFGIVIYAPDNTIGGTEAGAGNLISGNELNGVNLYGENASGNMIQGNLIGTDLTGTVALGNGENGVAIINAVGNTLGGTTLAAGNTLSGNVIAGVYLVGSETQNNLIQGNFIGTDPEGTLALGNGEPGIAIHQAASDNTIGGTTAAAKNVLSGNMYGILIGDLLCTGNRIQGNYIGTDAAGTGAIPNSQTGVLLWGQNTVIGGSEEGAGNVISGNGFAGIDLGGGSTGTIIQGNYIGTDATGTTALGNDLGLFVNFSPDNTIGGTASGAGNVISGNTGNGVTVNGLDASGNVFEGNFIGTNAAGTAKLGNDIGIQFLDAPNNTMGGTGAGASNVISGNTRNGIRVVGPEANGNVFLGNYIGTDATGTTDLGNGTGGVIFGNQGSDNIFGSTESGGGNVVAFNGRGGVVLTVNGGTGNEFRANSVFDNVRLGIDLANDLVTANDADDSDTGANNLQNYPVLTSVVSNGGAVVQATLTSTPSSSFDLDFFSSIACDEEGYGEGRTPLGSAALTTDASGSGTVTTSFSTVTGTVMTATATDVEGNTSEFSQCGDLTTLDLSASPATQTVTPGQSATYAITLAAQGGTFDETVALSCSGAPTEASCTLAADEVTLVAGQASTTLTITTAAPAGSMPLVPEPLPRDPGGWGWVLLLSLAGAVMLLIFTTRESGPAAGGRLSWNRSSTRVRWLGSAVFVGLVVLLQTSCGDDGTSPPEGGTPAGTYEITVTATWESLQQTTTATLVVQ